MNQMGGWLPFLGGLAGRAIDAVTEERAADLERKLVICRDTLLGAKDRIKERDAQLALCRDMIEDLKTVREAQREQIKELQTRLRMAISENAQLKLESIIDDVQDSPLEITPEEENPYGEDPNEAVGPSDVQSEGPEDA